MRKIMLLLPIAFISVFARAQVRFGVKGGYNLSTLIYSGTISLPGEQSISGFNAGIYASIPLAENLSLVPEVVYSSQGARFQNSYASGDLNFDYINIPVLLRYKLSMGLFFETGIQMGILLSANVKSNGNTTDLMYQTYSQDFAWPMGLGYQFPNNHFGIDMRYNLGLINIRKSGSDENIKNSVFQFGLFYTF